MAIDRMEQLHSFLNEEGRELVNIKFISGDSRGLTDEQLAEEARNAIKRAIVGGLIDQPPRAVQLQASK